MNVLVLKAIAVQAGIAALVTGLASVCCAAAASLLVGTEGMQAAFVAGAVSFPVAVVVLLFFLCRGVTPESIVLGTLLRMALTSVAAGGVVLVFASLRTPAFFVAVAVVYLANLSVETWFAFERNQGSRRLKASAEVSGSAGWPAC